MNDFFTIMPFLHTFHPSPIIAAVGPLTFRWYGLCLALGALAGYYVILWLARRYGYNEDRIIILFTVTVLLGFLGGRLYHVLNEPVYYSQHPGEILKVWHGGLAIHGAILAGAFVFLYFARRWKMRFFALTDLFVPGLILGQAIGRWGNYFNQELFGRPTRLPWGIPIDPASRPDTALTAQYFHPTFLYESLWDAGIFVLLLWIHKKKFGNGNVPEGVITALYLTLYALGRTGTELLRIDEVPIIAGVRLPLLVSILLVLVGGVGLWYAIQRNRNNQKGTQHP